MKIDKTIVKLLEEKLTVIQGAQVSLVPGMMRGL